MYPFKYAFTRATLHLVCAYGASSWCYVTAAGAFSRAGGPGSEGIDDEEAASLSPSLGPSLAHALAR